MDIYNKVLMELDKTSSLKSKINNLVKLYYSTEDRKLRDYIEQWRCVLLDAETFRERKLPISSVECMNEKSYIKNKLIDYCNECIMSRKPEWQILAERYGWKPCR
jgi:hypothetical protein